MGNSNIKENIDSLFNNLEKFTKTETVIGEPVVLGEVTLVPIISVMFGCGTGVGTGVDNKGMNGTGSGGGGGGKIYPNGIVVIKNNEVSMMPIKGKSNLDALVNMVPEILSKINIIKEKKECDSEEEKTE